MKLPLAALRSWIEARRRADARESADGTAPHHDLFTADEMQQHGLRLAAGHRLSARQGADRLLDRLDRNERAMAQVCKLLGSRTDPDRRVTPAGEWLLDNYQLIDEEIRTARRLFPAGYSRRLPRLNMEGRPSEPRAYALAHQVVTHADGRIDRLALRHFLEAYQSVHPLRLGELWAMPIILRLALIENLSRVAVRVADSLVEREMADGWADRMIEAEHLPGDEPGAGLDPCGAIQVIVNLAPGQTREVVFRLGMGRSDDEADGLVLQHRGAARAAAAFDAVQAQWRALLGAVRVRMSRVAEFSPAVVVQISPPG